MESSCQLQLKVLTFGALHIFLEMYCTPVGCSSMHLVLLEAAGSDISFVVNVMCVKSRQGGHFISGRKESIREWNMSK